MAFSLGLRRIWLPSFLGRLTFLLFTLALLTIYVYVLGNLQGFADETLILLTDIESWCLALSAISGFFSILAYAFRLTLRGRFRLDRIILSGLGMFFSLLLYLAMALMQAFMESYGI